MAPAVSGPRTSGAGPGPTGPHSRTAARRARRRREIAKLAGNRLLVAIPLVLAVSAGVFMLAAYSPFDPLVAFLGESYGRLSAEQREALSQTLGVTERWWVTWSTWLTGLFTGDFGFSRIYSQPVAEVVLQRMPWSILLSGAGLLVAAVIGPVLGLLAGLRPGSLLDRICAGLAIVVQSVPPFVLALLAIVVFALGLGVFPAGGASTVGQATTALSIARHLTLPALVLGISQAPWLMLSVRSSVQAAMSSDAVRGAVTRGVPWRTVVRRHVLPVSLAPLVTLLGVRLPELLVGAALVEEVFGWPGIAAALVASATAMDFALLAFLSTAGALMVLLGSLLADICYLFLDPRVRA